MAVVGTELSEDDELDRRALTEFLTVIDDAGQVCDAPGMFEVTSASGREYLVDMFEKTCGCADSKYRNRKCKHIRRGEFATGARQIPAWIDPDDIDPQLGNHCRGTVRWE